MSVTDIWGPQTLWFLARDGSQYGPITGREFRVFVEMGHLAAGDLVWRDGMPRWREAHTMREVAVLLAASTAAAAPAQPTAIMPTARQPTAKASPVGASRPATANAVAEMDAALLRHVEAARQGSAPRPAVAGASPASGHEMLAGMRSSPTEIFISYAKEDHAFVARLVAVLNTLGWTTFWDHNIEGGGNWRGTIEKQLAAARCVIVVWSPYSENSTWVYQEAEDAARRDCLIPIIINGVIPPFGMRDRQAVDLTLWKRGSAADRDLRRVLMAVAKHTRMPAELKHWPLVEGTRDPAVLQDFAAKHPNGAFINEAHARIAELSQSTHVLGLHGADSASGLLASARSAHGSPGSAQPGNHPAGDDLEHTWENVKSNRNLKWIEHFLVNYPDSPFKAEAEALIQEIWHPISVSRDYVLLEEFATQHAGSEYAIKAQLYALWHRMEAHDELIDIEKFMHHYILSGGRIDRNALDPLRDHDLVEEVIDTTQVDLVELRRQIKKAGGALGAEKLKPTRNAAHYARLIASQGGLLTAATLDEIERRGRAVLSTRRATSAHAEPDGTVPLLEPGAVIARITKVLVHALFHRRADQSIDFARGRRKVVDAHLEKFGSGYLHQKLEIARDWMAAVASPDPKAVKSFFVKHAVRGETQHKLIAALDIRKRQRQQRTHHAICMAWATTCALVMLGAVLLAIANFVPSNVQRAFVDGLALAAIPALSLLAIVLPLRLLLPAHLRQAAQNTRLHAFIQERSNLVALPAWIFVVLLVPAEIYYVLLEPAPRRHLIEMAITLFNFVVVPAGVIYGGFLVYKSKYFKAKGAARGGAAKAT